MNIFKNVKGLKHATVNLARIRAAIQAKEARYKILLTRNYELAVKYKDYEDIKYYKDKLKVTESSLALQAKELKMYKDFVGKINPNLKG